MSQPFIYREHDINLGEIGDHPLDVTVLIVSKWNEPLNVMITKAVAKIQFPGQPEQLLDVTYKVSRCVEWRELVVKAIIAARDAARSEPQDEPA